MKGLVNPTPKGVSTHRLTIVGLWGREESGREPTSCQSSSALGRQMREDCHTLSTWPRVVSGCVKPLTPHGGWWTRGSPRYQVLSLQHPRLDAVAELRTELWAPGQHPGMKGGESRGRGGAGRRESLVRCIAGAQDGGRLDAAR